MKFYRGRIAENEKGFSINDIGMPKANLAKSGRANSTGIPRLYLASDEKTVLHEIRSSMYDFVSVGVFELKQDMKVIDLQNIDKLSPFSDYDADIALFAINKQILHRLPKSLWNSCIAKAYCFGYTFLCRKQLCNSQEELTNGKFNT